MPVCDSGPELTSKALFFWSRGTGVKLHFIQAGKPTQNAFVVSFNGKFPEYCLDLPWFASLADARSTIDAWRDHYNYVRPHRLLGEKPPAVFAREAARYAQFPAFSHALVQGCGQRVPTRYSCLPLSQLVDLGSNAGAATICHIQK